MPGMTMPAQAAPADHSAMPGMNSAPAATADIPKTPPPPPPTDRAADRFFSAAAMDSAVAELRREHGAVITSKFMTNLAEYQARKGADGYTWDAQAWFGGDINRFVLKSEGEGTRGEGLEADAVRALRQRFDASTVLFVGDDLTDESVFADLSGQDVGIKVGSGESAALWRVESPQNVALLLQRLAQERSTFAV